MTEKERFQKMLDAENVFRKYGDYCFIETIESFISDNATSETEYNSNSYSVTILFSVSEYNFKVYYESLEDEHSIQIACIHDSTLGRSFKYNNLDWTASDELESRLHETLGKAYIDHMRYAM